MSDNTTEWFVAKALLALSQRRADEASEAFAACDPEDEPAPVDDPASSEADSFATRLWRLLRVRRALTADEAAELLGYAHEDLPQAQRRAGALLLTWSRQCPRAIRIAAKRVDGLKRYALQRDVGATPPVARGAA